MRLAKFASQKSKKNQQQKYELQQQQNNEWNSHKGQIQGGSASFSKVKLKIQKKIFRNH